MGPTVRAYSRSRRSGVTLAEAVVASSLLLLSLVPLLKALTATHAMDRAVERKSWSLLLAQRELERIRARCLYRYDESCRANSQVLWDGYLGTVTDDEHAELRTITVAVGFDRDRNGTLATEEIEVSLSTCLARRWPGPP